MNPWIAKGVFLAGLVVFIAIRAPNIERNRAVKVVERRYGGVERVLFTLMTLGVLILPLLSVLTPFLNFAEYPVVSGMFWPGAVCLPVSLWLFHRSHADLGLNWSRTLEIRENHGLVTRGVYTSIRHPMYAAIVLYAISQGLLLPNWIAGPSCIIAVALLFAGRVRAEERMMVDRFGGEYEAYRGRTKRLVPGVW